MEQYLSKNTHGTFQNNFFHTYPISSRTFKDPADKKGLVFVGAGIRNIKGKADFATSPWQQATTFSTSIL